MPAQDDLHGAYRMRNDDLKVTWCFCKENNHCIMHYHLCIEIIYMLEGEMNAVLEGAQMTLHAGEMLAVSSCVVHRFWTEKHSRVIVAVIPLPFLAPIREELENSAFRHPLFHQAPPLAVSLMHGLLENDPRGNTALTQGLSLALTSLLIQESGLERAPHSAVHTVLRDVIAYMQTHFDQPLTIDILARHAGYSRSWLSHLFQREMHITFTQYLGQLRCRRAALLLGEKSRSITEISALSGFDNLRSFYRSFQENYHMSPGAYRKQLLKQSPDSYAVSYLPCD